MKHCEISEILVCEQYVVPAEQTAQKLFRSLPHGKPYADRMIDAMATGYLVAVLESICAREIQRHLDPDEETVVGASVECRHCAPIPPGAILRVVGWVIGVGDHEATFWAQASDEEEVVCEVQIRFAVVRRARMERKIQRKCEAIGRREMVAVV